MKRILFSCCIAVLPFTASFAQVAVSKTLPATSTVSERALFSSHITELDAHVASNNNAKAQSTFTGLRTDMERNLANNKIALRDVSPADMPAARAKYDAKQKTYLEILDLSKDLIGNREAIHQKLTEYYTKY